MARFARAFAGLVVVVGALAGCSMIADVVSLTSSIDSAGYQTTSVDHNTLNGYTTLYIEAAKPGETATEADGDEIAEIAWTTYSGGFDHMQIVLNGDLVVNKTFDELRAQFGDRPEGMADGGSSTGSNVILIVVVSVIALGFAGLMVLVWHRGRRRAAAAQQVHPYPYPPQYPYQPPPTYYQRPPDGGAG